MTRRILTSGTALTMSLALALPAMPVAQTADVPPCENPQGKLWTDIIGPDDYAVGTGYELPDADMRPGVAGAKLAPGQSVCVIALPDARFFVAGPHDAAGRVVVQKRDVVAAAMRAGLQVGDRQVEGLAQQLQDAADALPQPQAAPEPAQQQQEQPEQAQPEPAQALQPQDEPQQAQEQQAQEQQAPEQQAQEQPQQQQPAQTRPQQAQELLREQAQQQLDALKGHMQDQQARQERARQDLADALAAQRGESPEQLPEQDQEVGQQDTAASTDAANTGVEAEAAAGDGAGVEVETDTVTEADTRSSAEDFATSVTGQVREDARRQIRQGDDRGMSNFEKFALGALGALVVGQILDSGEKVVSNSGDRVVVQRGDGDYEVLKDDDALLRRPGTEITTERFSDGSSRETMRRRDGTRVVTIKAADGQALRRTRILPGGREVVLFDDTRRAQPVDLSDLPRHRHRAVDLDATDPDQLRAALAAAEARDVGRRFSLQQIRQIRAVRELVPVIELDAITFDTDSAAIRPSEADELRDLGVVMQRMIERNPWEVFLVEGHTDAVGRASYNLALSDRRAESVALALTEYFDVPPENMVVQGYGESNLKVLTPGPERENRRATVRRITPLLYSADAR